MDKTYSAIIETYVKTKNGREDLFLLIIQLIEESKKLEGPDLIENLKKLSYLNSSIEEVKLKEQNGLMPNLDTMSYFQHLQNMILKAINEKEEKVCQTV